MSNFNPLVRICHLFTQSEHNSMNRFTDFPVLSIVSVPCDVAHDMTSIIFIVKYYSSRETHAKFTANYSDVHK